MPRAEEFKKNIFEGTVSGLASFPDFSSIEFMALEDSAKTTGKESFISDFLKHHEGVRMFSLSSSSVDTTYAWLSSQGLEVDSIRDFRLSSKPAEGWSMDDGRAQIRAVDFDSVSPPAYLPRFEEDRAFNYQQMQTEWKTYFAFSRSFSKHPNGVIGIAALKIAVEDLEAAREAYSKMGLPELKENRSEHLARFKLKEHQEIQLIASKSPDDEIADFLADRGPGVFAVVFEVKNLYDTHCFLRDRMPDEALRMDSLPDRLTVLKEHAFGVQLEFQEESEEQSLLAQQLQMGPKLDEVAQQNAEGMYLKYCALCHGEDREGYAADFAPSLRSHSLLATAQSTNFLRYTIQFGRANTAMAGYLSTQGGPLEYIDIELILQWLYEESGVEEPIKLSREPVMGDMELGAEVYAKNCSICHGQNGEGVTGPALGNPMLLATATDEFLRYAIQNGRDSTLMPSFKDSLSKVEIDAVTAFLRSRASGWDVPKVDTVSIPKPENYVLNPNGPIPNFNLREGRFLPAEQLNEALEDSVRIVLLDARSEVAWRQTHIPGSFPVPYYEEPENFLKHIPKNDSTWVVAYCACPHAASERVISTLNRYGYKNTAILDEGILVWAQMGYSVQHGQ